MALESTEIDLVGYFGIITLNQKKKYRHKYYCSEHFRSLEAAAHN
jgi:hypothetical protein